MLRKSQVQHQKDCRDKQEFGQFIDPVIDYRHDGYACERDYHGDDIANSQLPPDNRDAAVATIIQAHVVPPKLRER